MHVTTKLRAGMRQQSCTTAKLVMSLNIASDGILLLTEIEPIGVSVEVTK